MWQPSARSLIIKKDNGLLTPFTFGIETIVVVYCDGHLLYYSVFMYSATVMLMIIFLIYKKYYAAAAVDEELLPLLLSSPPPPPTPPIPPPLLLLALSLRASSSTNDLTSYLVFSALPNLVITSINSSISK